MPDQDITALTDLATPQAADLLAIVDDVAGTPITKKVTLTNLMRGGSEFTIPGWVWLAQDSISALAAQAAAQSVFDDANDTVSLVASTKYQMEGQYIVSTGQTSHTTLLGFLAGGGLTVNHISYVAVGCQLTAANTNSTGQSGCWVNQLAHTAVVPAQTTNDVNAITFQGIVSVNAGGTVTPQISFSANPTGTNQIEVGSYIRFIPLGPAATDFVGPWA